MPAPLLILQTGHPITSMHRYGSFSHWIRVASGLGRDEAIVVDVEHGEALPSREGFAGVLVTGSAAMVTERLDWSERSADWLREAAQAGLPVLGICYGHQLLAHAFGGEVDYNPKGREIGTVNIELTAAASGDPLFAGLPMQFPVQATHMQSVLKPSADAVVLASNDHDACHALRWGDSTWGVQFHPEFGTAHMRGYINARADDLARAGRHADSLHAAVKATPLARRVLRRFVRHIRR